MALAPGTRFGPYEITAQLGEGGMGEVYRASDTTLKRAVAIKVLPDALAADVERLGRFRREAEVLASLNHPHIAAIYGFEQTGPTPALVMELVDGPTLADRIAQGPIPIAETLVIAGQIANALEAAHEQGIVHRDLKPANVKVRLDGVVKVLDFGLAKALEPPRATSQGGVTHSPTMTSPALMTGAGVLLGTAAYMSPEQARGKAVDKRADVWAFGAVLYEMLTGQRPFAGDDVSDVLASVLAREPDWTLLPAALPPVLGMFIKRCLHKDQAQRVRDIGDMSLALEGAFDAAAAPFAPPVAAAEAAWRRALPLAATAIVAFLIAGLAAWRLWPAAESRSTTQFDYLLPEGQQLLATQRPAIAISPDGRHFVYQTRQGLHVRSMGELEARRITGTEETLLSPFLSPDGQWVAYVSSAGELKKIAIGGGTPVTLCSAEFPYGASWTRDNTILLGQRRGIVRVSANGGTPELIVAAGEGEELYGPQLLPGGRSVLFIVAKGQGPNRWEQAQVAVQSLSSGQRTVVVQRGSDAHYLPTGHLVYAVADGVFGTLFDAERLTVTGAAVPLVQGVQRAQGVVAVGSNYAVSDTGTLVYVAGRSSLYSLVWMNRDGTADRVTSIPAGSYQDLRLSPDGGRVLVTRDGDIWIYDLASGRNSRLTRDGTSLMGVWDPSGSQVAYSSAKGGNLEAWVASSDGSGQPRQLTKLGGQVHVDSWSPDGRRLALHHHRLNLPAPILMVAMDASDPKPEVFIGGEFNAEGANFSRDGHYVSYLSQETGQREIYVRPYPGPGGQVTVSVGGGQEPVWAKNGDVFYRNLTGDRMFAVRVTTEPALKVGTSVQLFQGTFYIAPTGSPRPQYDVTADGKRLLMLAPGSGTDSSAARGRVVVVERWFEELQSKVPTK
jgi:Tol biopolymer transport system component